MHKSNRHQATFICGLIFLGIVILLFTRFSQQNNLTRKQIVSPVNPSNGAGNVAQENASQPRPVAPFVVTDTATDSPGTNLETRVVTFSAEIGGTPPVFKQWKVDKGHGFLPVSASATNAEFIIPNAHLADSGRYALFATNSAGGTNTTPVPLVVVEGVD